MNWRRGCSIAFGCASSGSALTVVCVLVAAHFGAAAWNGRVDLRPDPDDALWLRNAPDDASQSAALAFATAVNARCAPSTNGLRVLFDQLWYNAMTSGYAGRVWLEDEQDRGVGFYLWKDRIFVRERRAPYGTQVLACEVPVQSFLDLVPGH